MCIRDSINSAPTIIDEHVFVITANGQAFALDEATGRIKWQQQSTLAGAMLLGGSSVADYGRLALLPFDSGELTAVLKNSGLANLNIAGMAKVNLNNAGGKEQAAIGQLIAAMDGKTVCVQSSTIHQNFLEKHMSGAVDVKLYQAVDDHNLDLAAGRCDAVLADVGSIIDFMESDGGVDVAFTGPTFSGGVFGDGVGGAVRKEDTDILEMWNAAIAEMSKDGTTAEITKEWFGRDISM